LVIHVEGATIPGAPVLPECLKADVYLPPHLLDEYPECQLPIAAIVQTYIEDIGIPTVNRYIAAGRKFGWSFTQNRSTYAIPSSQNLPLIPPPAKAGSAHYVFQGRPYGSLPLPPQHSNSDQHRPMPTASSPSSRSESTDGYFLDDPNTLELTLLNAAEKIADLESGLERAALAEANYVKEITNLRKELAETYATLRQQEARLAEHTSSSYPSTQSSPSYRVSPFTSPQSSKKNQHVVHNRFPQLDNLAYVSNPSYPEKVPNMSASHFIQHETTRTRPNQEAVGSTTVPTSYLGPATTQFITAHQHETTRTRPNQEAVGSTTVPTSYLGPATTQFITAHNLTRFGPLLSLIFANHPPTKWSAMLRVLSLSDNVHDGLLDVLTTDLETEEAGN
jgi:hypothetical protein